MTNGGAGLGELVIDAPRRYGEGLAIDGDRRRASASLSHPNGTLPQTGQKPQHQQCASFQQRVAKDDPPAPVESPHGETVSQVRYEGPPLRAEIKTRAAALGDNRALSRLSHDLGSPPRLGSGGGYGG